MSPAGRPLLMAAVGGGIVGAALTLGVVVVAARSGMGEPLVREALLANPDMLTEAADALRDRQYAPVIAANAAALTTPFGSSWEGAARPEGVLVEFSDFACPYCRSSLPVIDRLLAEDKGLRVVYRELPILGPESVAAARLALAASKAGRYARFHDALWAAGRPSAASLQNAAKAAAIPFEPPQGADYEAELRRNFDIAGQLGATGTPLFVVGNRVLNGAVGYDQLKAAIAAARKG